MRHLSPGLGAELYSQEARPPRGARSALTTAGPAPLAAIARLAGDALEAARFVFTFAIRAGARVATLVDVCMEGKRKRTSLGKNIAGQVPIVLEAKWTSFSFPDPSLRGSEMGTGLLLPS